MSVSPVIPSLRFRDARSAITFLVDGLGFRLTFCFPEEGERVEHAELVRGEGMVMLGSAGGRELALPVGGASIYLIVDSDQEVDRLYRQAVDAGATPTIEPRDEDYGGRGASITDADGNAWSIGSYRPHPAEASGA
jgi:uncharacterized glyoxalase superfamily protein PhnB